MRELTNVFSVFPGHPNTYAQAKIDKLPTDFVEELAAREQLTGSRFTSKWTVAVSCLGIGVAVLAAAAGYTTGNFVGPPGLGEQIYGKTENIEENLLRVLQEARERVAASDDAENDLEAMRKEVASKSKELEERDKELEIRDKTSLDLEVSEPCCCVA